jgi:FkbM family methyltransferase
VVLGDRGARDGERSARRGDGGARRLGALGRILRRAWRHPGYALHVLGVLVLRPRLLLDALRRGWRPALLQYCGRLQPQVARLLSPYEAGFFGQVFLFDEYEVGRLALPAAPTVVDVGANVGLFTWRVQTLRPRARVLALEPEADNYERLEAVFASLGVRGQARRQACGRSPGTATLFLRNSVTHSLDPGWHTDLDRGAGTETVEVVTLDAACAEAGFRQIDLLKVDVEGAEVEVLAGATEVLAHTRHVVLEYHSAERRAACRALLEANGFRCREKRFFGVHAQGDGQDEGLLLCSRPGRAEPATGAHPALAARR